MVAYLKKPTGSEGFQKIVDFLNGSHIRFALTKNPTIYVSLIKKFWQTATVRTVDNGEQEITATVDGKEFTITEASVRRHLQLADVEGISTLPTTEIFDQLSLMGNMKRGFSGEHTPLFPSMLAIQAEEGEGSGHPSEPQPSPFTAQPIHEELIPNVTSEPIPNVADETVYEERDDRVERATTTVARLDAAQASDRVLALETDLRQTNKVYGAAYTKLIMKVKTLEKTVKSNQARRRAKIVISDDEEDLEDSSKQGRMISEIYQMQRRRRAVSTGSGGVSTASRLFSTAEELVSTAGASMPVSTADTVQEVNKDKEICQQLFEEEQAQFEREQRIAREKAAKQEAKDAALIEQMEDMQARIDAYELLPERLQQ
ncbi:hypothetical protein Tco_0693670 [Tanacetum coccineum]